jgi:hypothetical protein
MINNKSLAWRCHEGSHTYQFHSQFPQKVPAHGQSFQQASQRALGTQPSPGRATQGSQAAQDHAECRICGRQFVSDRIAIHQEICAKTAKKKRKVFDATKHRVKGTEAEGFVKKGQPNAVPVRFIFRHIKLFLLTFWGVDVKSGL